MLQERIPLTKSTDPFAPATRLFPELPSQEENFVLLEQLLNSPLPQCACEAEGLVPRSHYLLDMIFEDQDGNWQSVSMPLFGFRHVVGIKVLDDTSEESQQILVQQPEVAALLVGGGDIAILKPEDVEAWSQFYTALLDQGHYERIGDAAFEVSGLTRVTPIYYERLRKDILNLVGQHYELLLTHGVENVTPSEHGLSWKGFKHEVCPEARLDGPFLRADLETVVGVPLAHLRTAELVGNILVEQVEENLAIVPGFIITRIGENKREAYSRTKQAQTYYQKLWGGDTRIVIPVISAGQINLWRKLGFSDTLRSALRDTNAVGQLEAEDLVRFLYLGGNNLRYRDLAARGYSLPGKLPKLNGIDILFYKKDQYGQLKISALSEPIYGLDLNAMKKGKQKLKPIDNVAGLAVVPSD